jgi:hypothetical protein
MGTLIPICPALTSFSNFRAVAPDWVKMAVPFPYLLALIISRALSSVSAAMTVSTGPKISSLQKKWNLMKNEECVYNDRNIPVASHGGHSFDDGGSNKVSMRIPLDLDISSI